MADLICLDDARRHDLQPGDSVLAPRTTAGAAASAKDTASVPYLPGRVLDGRERRSGDVDGSHGNHLPLVVALDLNDKEVDTGLSGCIALGPGLAVWIPDELRDRLCLQAAMPRGRSGVTQLPPPLRLSSGGATTPRLSPPSYLQATLLHTSAGAVPSSCSTK